jgi:hypothetical protein
VITIDRGAEPDELVRARSQQLASALISGRPDDFQGYNLDSVRKQLAAQQGYGCAYCESDIEGASYPIEHLRPKAVAEDVNWIQLGPLPQAGTFFQWFDQNLEEATKNGWLPDRDRYWWLAWTWENLFLACPTCNNFFKKNRFPLRNGSSKLGSAQLDQPPGNEDILLIDPSQTDPLDHISFAPSRSDRTGWGAVARTDQGHWTIAVLGLNKRQGLQTKRDAIAKDIEDGLDFIAVNNAIQGATPVDADKWSALLRRALNPGLGFLGFRWNVLNYWFNAQVRRELNLNLPRPGRLSTAAPKPVWDARPELVGLPPALEYRVRALGDRAEQTTMQALLVDLCRPGSRSADDLAQILRRDEAYLRNNFLTPMSTGNAPTLDLDPTSATYRAR